MALTPLDVLQKQFQPARKAGYDPEDVHRFLDQMREAWEASLGENHRLREELRQRDQEIADLRARADEVRETLVLARRMTLDIEANARREADLILGEARLEAERIVASVHEEKLRLEQELVRLKTTRVHHVAQMRATLAATGRMLDEIERD